MTGASIMRVKDEKICWCIERHLPHPRSLVRGRERDYWARGRPLGQITSDDRNTPTPAWHGSSLCCGRDQFQVSISLSFSFPLTKAYCRLIPMFKFISQIWSNFFFFYTHFGKEPTEFPLKLSLQYCKTFYVSTMELHCLIIPKKNHWKQKEFLTTTQLTTTSGTHQCPTNLRISCHLIGPRHSSQNITMISKYNEGSSLTFVSVGRKFHFIQMTDHI